MSVINPKVNFFFDKATQWQDEYRKLRTIILDCGLAEELKWGVPCYIYNGANVVLIHGFKEYCAILFVKGALLKDPEGLLFQQTKNVQAGRQVRFTNLQEIVNKEPTLKSYIQEAIEIEKEGLKVDFKQTSEFSVPEEFVNKLDEVPNLKEAFDALTPGRQRAYLLYFSSPKLSKTRAMRIEKYVDHILNGKGLDD
jgi:uncharacterized protein YdeI (YjbR/CyaY-like superfamily)